MRGAVGERGEHEHVRLLLGEDLARGLDPVHARHVEVHQHDVGLELLGLLDRLGAVGGGADELDVLEPADQAAEAVADDAVVVGEQDADHRGTSSVTVVPCPGAESTVSVPPACATRSPSSERPTWPSSRAVGALGGVEAAAVVGDGERRGRDGHRDGARLGVRGDVAQRLARDAVDERVVAPALVLDGQVGLDPLRPQRAEQVVEHGLEARGLQPGRVDLDQQRAHVPHTLAQRVDGIVHHPRLLVVPAAARVGRQRRQTERHAGQVLHHAVVQVGGDPASLAVLRLDRSGQQPLAFLVAALQAAGERPRQRDLEEQQDQQPGDHRRRQRAEDPARGRVDRAEALVDLEQHLGAVGRADDGVRLQQLVLLALEAVLGLAQVAELGVRAARLEQLGLLLAQREALADEPRLVGVEDRAVLRPDLHAHDRLAQDLALDDVVDPRERLRVAGEHAVVVGAPPPRPACPRSRRARACRARPPRSPPRAARRSRRSGSPRSRRGCRAGTG